MEQRDYSTFLGFHPDIPRQFHIGNSLYFISPDTAMVPETDIKLRSLIEIMCGTPVKFVLESSEFITALQNDSAGFIDPLDSFIKKALMNSASDLHLEPHVSGLKLKIRKDGFLYTIHEIPDISHGEKIVSRAKVLSGCDIAETMLPQDGRFSYEYNNTVYNIRTSILPTPFGESAVLRFLKSGAPEFSFENTGIAESERNHIIQSFSYPAGFYIICGPTGSGKTTTAYALIEKFRNRAKKLVSVEEPVEYILEDAVQVSLNRKKGLSFSNAVRSVMRHDPDMVFVGEIRDSETALSAVNFALTGHRVITTVHASTPAEAVERISAMGVRAEDLLMCTRLIISQRLARKLCESCRGAGCEKCFKSGYAGRIGIFETVVIKPGVSEIQSKNDLKILLQSSAVKSLADDAAQKASQGITDTKEIHAVCGECSY